MDATYSTSNSIPLAGDHTFEFVSGRRVRADCGIDGIKYLTIKFSTYDPVSNKTIVVFRESILTPNLSTIKLGIVGAGDTQSLPDHNHTSDEGEGGGLDRYVPRDESAIIAATHTFNPSKAEAPFKIGSNGSGQLVKGLNSEKLSGLSLYQILEQLPQVAAGQIVVTISETEPQTPVPGTLWINPSK